MVETTSVQNSTELGPTPWDHFDLDKVGDASVIKPGSHLDILYRQEGREPVASVKTETINAKNVDSGLHDFDQVPNKPTDLVPEPTEKSVEEMSDEELKASAQDFFDKGDFDSSIDILRHITSKRMVNKIAGTLVLKLVEDKNFERADDYAQLISDKDFFTEVQTYIKDEEEKVLKASPFAETEVEEDPLSAFDSKSITQDQVVPGPTGVKEEDPLEEFTDSAEAVTAKVVPVELTSVALPEVEVGLDQKIEQSLESARKEYATHLVEWKNTIREKKSRFRKVLADLGVDRQLPQEAEPEELIEARNAYVKAKKEKNKALIESMLHVPNQAQRPLGLFEAEASENRDKLSEEAEREFELLQKLISEGISVEGKPAPLEKGVQLERGTILKALDVWRSLNQMQRLAITSTVVFGAGMFGGLGVLGAASFAGMRAVKSIGRSAAGVATSLGAGKVVDIVYDGKNAENKNLAFKKYLQEINLDNFNEKEMEVMQFLEGEKDEKKRQMLKKALVMGLTAGATNVGLSLPDILYGASAPIPQETKLGVGELAPVPKDPEVTFVNEVPGRPVPITFSSEQSITPDLPSGMELKPESIGELESGLNTADTVPSDVPEAKVSLSSRGFIQDIHTLKAEILAEYHDKPIPEAVQNKILSVPSAKLAEQLGLYDGAHNASGVGLKGEHLIFKDGEILYGSINGEEKPLFNPLTGEVHKFDGEFVSAEAPQVSEKAVDLSSESSVQETNIETESKSATEMLLGDPITTADELKPTDPSLKVSNVPNEEPVVLTNEQNLKIDENVPQKEIVPGLKIPVDGGKSVDVVSLGGQRVVSFEGLPIGHEEGGLLTLDNAYQDGPENADVRSVFAKAFEGTVKDSLGPRPIAESFEGGKIYVSFGVPTDPEKVRILLNGKEIAVGTLKNGVPDVEIHSELKRPWYLSDSVYQRAFKHMNELMKTGSFNFKT